MKQMKKYADQYCTSSQYLRAKNYTFCLKKHKRFISLVFLASFRRRRKKAPLDSLLFLSESDLVYFSLTSFFKFPGTQFSKERKKNIITSFSGKFCQEDQYYHSSFMTTSRQPQLYMQ